MPLGVLPAAGEVGEPLGILMVVASWRPRERACAEIGSSRDPSKPLSISAYKAARRVLEDRGFLGLVAQGWTSALRASVLDDRTGTSAVFVLTVPRRKQRLPADGEPPPVNRPRSRCLAQPGRPGRAALRSWPWRESTPISAGSAHPGASFRVAVAATAACQRDVTFVENHGQVVAVLIPARNYHDRSGAAASTALGTGTRGNGHERALWGAGNNGPLSTLSPDPSREREHDQARSERYRRVSPTRDDHEPQP